MHYGKGAKFGHYISYVKSPKDEWFKCNDTRISKCTVEDVLKEQAYVLFYRLWNQIQQEGKVTPKSVEKMKHSHQSNEMNSPEVPLKSVLKWNEFQLPKSLQKDNFVEDILKMDQMIEESEESFKSEDYEDEKQNTVTKEDIENMK